MKANLVANGFFSVEFEGAGFFRSLLFGRMKLHPTLVAGARTHHSGGRNRRGGNGWRWDKAGFCFWGDFVILGLIIILRPFFSK